MPIEAIIPAIYPEVVREKTENEQVIWLNSSPPKVEPLTATSSEEPQSPEAQGRI